MNMRLIVPTLLALPAGTLASLGLGLAFVPALGVGAAAAVSLCAAEGVTRHLRRKRADIESMESVMLDNVDHRRQLENVMASLADGLVLADAHGRITAANPAACRMLGKAEDDLRGTSTAAALGLAPDADEDLVRTLRERGSLENMETILPEDAKNGRTIVQFSSAVVLEPCGSPTGMVHTLRDVTNQKQGEKWLMRQALHDDLTGLPNRQGLVRTLEQHFDVAEPEGCVIHLALDRFRRVNQAFGREEADRVLTTMANRLIGSVRATDMVARTGGDEFTLYLPEVTDRQQAEETMGRLMKAVGRPATIGPREHTMTACGGLVMAGKDFESPESLLDAAETAMLRAKDNGEGHWLPFSKSMRSHNERYAALEGALLECLEEECLEVVYQPLVEAHTGTIIGLEALARLTHPMLGKVPPEEFISLAEEAGLIAPLGRLIRRRAVSEFLAFDLDGVLPTLHLNVAAAELVRPDFADDLLALLEEYGVPPTYVAVEVAEAAVADDPDTVAEALAVLKNEGVSIVLDDYGIGFLGLSLLTRLPLDSVKLHNSLITGAKYRLGSLKLSRGLASLARHLRLSIVAEGVETLDDVEIVHTLGCESYQGFFFAEPMPAKDLTALLGEMKHFAHDPSEDISVAGAETWKM